MKIRKIRRRETSTSTLLMSSMMIKKINQIKMRLKIHQTIARKQQRKNISRISTVFSTRQMKLVKRGSWIKMISILRVWTTFKESTFYRLDPLMRPPKPISIQILKKEHSKFHQITTHSSSPWLKIQRKLRIKSRLP